MKKEKANGFCAFSPLVEGKTKANVKKNNGEGRKAPPPPPIKNFADNAVNKNFDLADVSNCPSINFFNVDCIGFMKLKTDNFYDLAIVDPPYGIGMSNSNKRTKPSRPNSYTKYANFRYHETNWDNERPTAEYFEQLFRVSKEQIIFGANYFCEYLPSGKGWLFWNKLNGLGNYFSDGEFAFTSKGIQSKYFECSAFHNLSGGKDRIHPTQKPVKLYRWVLQNYAKPNDKILDTHGGSMSISIACDLEGFDLDLCEIDKIYFKNGTNEYKKHKRQQRLF